MRLSAWWLGGHVTRSFKGGVRQLVEGSDRLDPIRASGGRMGALPWIAREAAEEIPCRPFFC